MVEEGLSVWELGLELEHDKTTTEDYATIGLWRAWQAYFGRQYSSPTFQSSSPVPHSSQIIQSHVPVENPVQRFETPNTLKYNYYNDSIISLALILYQLKEAPMWERSLLVIEKEAVLQKLLKVFARSLCDQERTAKVGMTLKLRGYKHVDHTHLSFHHRWLLISL